LLGLCGGFGGGLRCGGGRGGGGLLGCDAIGLGQCGLHRRGVRLRRLDEVEHPLGCEQLVVVEGGDG
jgi:hypothetical protein